MSSKKYLVNKVFNNNVLLAVDKENGKELVLVGKGIGFGKTKKEGKLVEIKDEQVEKSFVAFDDNTKEEYYQLMGLINEKVIGVSEEIIAMSEDKFGRLNSHIHIALTDHIGFALDRIKTGMEINNPFIYEIKALYPKEFELGQKAAEIIKARLGVEISESEMGFIALHIHSARENKKVTETIKDTKFLKKLINIIEEDLDIHLNNNDLMYSRLVNHLRMTIIRLEEKKNIENPLLNAIREQFYESYKTATKVGKYIESEKNIHVTDEELGFMALHIERIKETVNNPALRS